MGATSDEQVPASEQDSALRLNRPALAGISMGAATSLAYLREFGFDQIRAYAHMDQIGRAHV